MLRKWLLYSSMVTESRCCQEMLIEGQILNNSIHHCFHNCLHPPSWTRSLVKRRDGSNYCFWQRQPAINYTVITALMMISIILFTLVTCGLCPAHLNFLWQVRSIHIYRPLSHILLISLFFPSGAGFRLVRRSARQQHSCHDRCMADITFHDSFPGRILLWGTPPEEMSLGALGITSAVPAVARRNTCSLKLSLQCGNSENWAW